MGTTITVTADQIRLVIAETFRTTLCPGGSSLPCMDLPLSPGRCVCPIHGGRRIIPTTHRPGCSRIRLSGDNTRDNRRRDSDPQHKGTGLGLPITKGFAELLGGSISVQKVEG